MFFNGYLCLGWGIVEKLSVLLMASLHVSNSVAPTTATDSLYLVTGYVQLIAKLIIHCHEL